MNERKTAKKKESSNVKTFPVPFLTGEINEDLTINTKTNSKPSKTEIINQAFKLHSQGNILEAIKYYKLFIDQGFKDQRVFANYGVILNNLGKLKEAENSYRKAIEMNPNFAEAHSNLGNILNELGKLQEAEFSTRKAIGLNPNLANSHYNLGNILKNLGKSQEAEKSYRKAIALQPGYAKAYSNLGNILKDLGKLKEAELSARKALEINPNFAEAHTNLGNILNEIGNSKEAEESTRKAIEINPNLANSHYNLGNILSDLGKSHEAEKSYRKAIELDPCSAEALNNLAFILLKEKKFKEGFNKYEWRFKVNEMKNLKEFEFIKDKPEWTPNNNGRVLLWAEQGVGNEIQFASMISEIVEQVDQLIVKADERLIPLFKRSFNQEIIYINRTQLIDVDTYDYHIAMGSLLKFLRKSKEDFEKCKKKYIRVNEIKSHYFKENLKDIEHKKIVGISWRTIRRKDRGLNFSLERFLLGIYSPKIKFVCLQYGDVEKEITQLRKKHRIKVEIINELDLFNDIDGLASLIAACDEIVSIDNVTFQLAGAIGIKTHILIPKECHWLHGVDDKKSYWYPSVNLYRQNKTHEWDLALKEIKNEIKVKN
tara:strand:- start:1058 stop:2854 length:1797 start_codon:yes stop_codon:yes gene_type:complete